MALKEYNKRSNYLLSSYHSINAGREGTLGCYLQCFMMTFSHSLAVHLWGLLLVHWVECPNVTSTNFVYHHWEFTSIYRPLCHPFRSLVSMISFFVGLDSEGVSVTSVRRISTETRGWSVSPATVILWGWTRTGLSVTGGQEHASV